MERAEGGAQAANASSGSCCRSMADIRADRALPILWGTWQQARAESVSLPVSLVVVRGASASQPEKQGELGPDEAADQPLAAQSADHTSRFRSTPVRHYLRQEPSAVVPHAGICAGRRATGVPTATNHAAMRGSRASRCGLRSVPTLATRALHGPDVRRHFLGDDGGETLVSPDGEIGRAGGDTRLQGLTLALLARPPASTTPRYTRRTVMSTREEHRYDR